MEKSNRVKAVTTYLKIPIIIIIYAKPLTQPDAQQCSQMLVSSLRD
jgi:hypothetical protein